MRRHFILDVWWNPNGRRWLNASLHSSGVVINCWPFHIEIRIDRYYY